MTAIHVQLRSGPVLPRWRVFRVGAGIHQPSLGVLEAPSIEEARAKAQRLFDCPVTIVPAYRGAEITHP